MKLMPRHTSITRAALALALLAASCSQPQPAPERTAKADPLHVLYRLVPRTPDFRDVSHVDRRDDLGRQVAWGCYVIPQVRLPLATLTAEFGAPDTVVRASHGIPLMLHRDVPGLTLSAVEGAESAYMASTPATRACWGKVWAYVENDTVQLVFVVDAYAESLIYAPAARRMSRPQGG